MKELITKKMKSPVWIVALSITASEILYIAISLLFNEPIFGFWIMATAGIAGGVSFVASSTMRSNYIQIEAQKEELERLNQLNQELFSAISHDIRSPLSSISMVLDLVTSKTLTTEESVELLHDLFVDIGHLIQFLDELLLWSKRQIDKKPLIPEDLSTKYVIEETVHLYKKLIEKKGISLDLNNIEGSVLVDKGSYSFVVRNVLQNAIKFTPKGGSVSVSVQEKGAELTTLIKDSGVGIDAHTINAILTKSSYTSTLGTNNEKGVGFGLLASIGYLEKQEGCLHIESELGKGTTVSIILPKS